MVFIKIFIKDECNKNVILDWMIEQLLVNGDVSLIELLRQFIDNLTIENNDILSYHNVGWNMLDLPKIYEAKQSLGNLEIPEPKVRFCKHYT